MDTNVITNLSRKKAQKCEKLATKTSILRPPNGVADYGGQAKAQSSSILTTDFADFTDFFENTDKHGLY